MTRHAVLALPVAFLLLAAGLAGCAVNPTTGQQVFTGFASENQEISTGRQQHPQIVKAFGGEYDAPEIQRYVDSVGQLLARTVERRKFKYTFTVLNSGIVNAFALPGGYIYVSRGLIALAENEAELAGVLAHELGHVNALHHSRRQGQDLLAGLIVAGLGVGFGQGAAQLGSTVAVGALRSYSREHELEADSLALRYMARTGYDPSAMVSFLAKMRDDSRLEAKRMGKSPDSVDESNYLATHPAPAERVQRAQAQAAGYSVRNPMIARDIYLKKIDGMLYGDDPSQGLIRGTVFAHPGLRLRFEVPQGFQLFNSDEAVLAKGPNEAAIIFDSEKKPTGGSMISYLTRVWAAKVSLANVEGLRVNGLEAATGTVQASTNSGPRDVRLVAIRRDRQTIYRFMFVTRPGDTNRFSVPFRRTTFSFRSLSAAEAGALRPFRIRLVRVRQGDTVASLARRMASYDGFAAERFRVLNGLSGNQQPRPGTLAKIVTE